jgi:ankyrin repeat protein
LMAATLKSVACVRLMLEHGADVNAAATVDGETPLIMASGRESSAIVQLLLDAGADYEYIAGDQRSPLMRAAMAGCVTNIRILLNAGAAVNLSGADGATAFSCACRYGHLYAAKALYDAGAPVNPPDGYELPLHNAIRAGNEDLVHFLMQLEADVNKTREADHTTPLITAVAQGHTFIASKLIRAGADIKAAEPGEAAIEKSPMVQQFLRGFDGKYMGVDMRWKRRRPAIEMWSSTWRSSKPLLEE